MEAEYLQTSKFYPCSRKNINYLHLSPSRISWLGFHCHGCSRVSLHSLVSTNANSFKPNCSQDSSKIANHTNGTPALPSIAVHIHANASMQKYWRPSQKPTSMLLSSVIDITNQAWHLPRASADKLRDELNRSLEKTVTETSNRAGWNHVFKLHYGNPAPGYPPAWVQRSRVWANANVAYRNRPWQHRLAWTHPLKYIIYIHCSIAIWWCYHVSPSECETAKFFPSY